MQGDPQPVKTVALIPGLNACPNHVPGNVTAGPADDFIDKFSPRVFTCFLSAVAGQEVKRNPHMMVGEFFEIPVIEHFVGRADVGVHGAVVKSNGAAVDGIINVLCCVSDRVGFTMPETGKSGRDIGCGMVKVNLHIWVDPMQSIRDFISGD
jgi:hypothetical protein